MLLAPILVSFLVTVIKYPDEKNLGEKGLVLVQSFKLYPIVTGKSQQQDLEEVGHITRIIKSKVQ